MNFSISEAKQQTEIPLVITDREGIVQDVNVPFEQVFGWTAAEIRGQHVKLLGIQTALVQSL